MSCPNVWRCSFIVVQLNYMACIHLNFIKKNMWIYRPRGLGLSSHFHGLTEALCLPSILSAVLTTGSRVGLNESVCVCVVCVLHWLKVMVCINREGDLCMGSSLILFYTLVSTAGFYLSVSSTQGVRLRVRVCACVWPAGPQFRLLSPWRGLLPVVGRLGFLCWEHCCGACVCRVQ